MEDIKAALKAYFAEWHTFYCAEMSSLQAAPAASDIKWEKQSNHPDHVWISVWFAASMFHIDNAYLLTYSAAYGKK